jgi:hypothetical protein
MIGAIFPRVCGSCMCCALGSDAKAGQFSCGAPCNPNSKSGWGPGGNKVSVMGLSFRSGRDSAVQAQLARVIFQLLCTVINTWNFAPPPEPKSAKAHHCSPVTHGPPHPKRCQLLKRRCSSKLALAAGRCGLSVRGEATIHITIESEPGITTINRATDLINIRTWNLLPCRS